MQENELRIVVGYHGCDIETRNSVVNGEELLPSTNSYDWLGHGVYFWENDYTRAYEWAVEMSERKNSSVKTPAVLGACIALGHCLDLTNRESIRMLKVGYNLLKENILTSGGEMPHNEDVPYSDDLLLRDLDCAVIQQIHDIKRNDSPYDTVRGLFIEGEEVYPGSGFREKTHIQICVVNPDNIIGYFLPRV